MSPRFSFDVGIVSQGLSQNCHTVSGVGADGGKNISVMVMMTIEMSSSMFAASFQCVSLDDGNSIAGEGSQKCHRGEWKIQNGKLKIKLPAFMPNKQCYCRGGVTPPAGYCDAFRWRRAPKRRPYKGICSGHFNFQLASKLTRLYHFPAPWAMGGG